LIYKNVSKLKLYWTKIIAKIAKGTISSCKMGLTCKTLQSYQLERFEVR